MPRLDVVIVGHNYAPEPVGIGPCTTGMAEMLAAEGHQVRVVCGTPCYPQWTLAPGYAQFRATRRVENGVEVLRLPHFVPADPHGWRRILHHLSFALLAMGALIRVMLARRPDVIVAIAPSLFTILVARLFAVLVRRPLWIHVQDFEADMALATGQLRAVPMGDRVARRLERAALRGDRVSSISPAMCRRLVAKGVGPDRIVEFRNWAHPAVVPLRTPSRYRALWGIDQRFVALYSGNIAAKQGVEIIAEAARLLKHRRDLVFVICGEGPNRRALDAAVADCGNIRCHDLQPAAQLGDLLGLATIHLLPQIAGVADLVLPSKLPNMLASGRPVVATAAPGSGLASEVSGCGLVTPPHDAAAFAGAIVRLVDDASLRATLGAAAEARVAAQWSRDTILHAFERELRLLVVERRLRRATAPGADAIGRPIAE